MLLTDRAGINRDKLVDAIRAEGGIRAVTVAYPVPLYRTKLFQEMSGHGLGCPWSCPFYGRKVQYKPPPQRRVGLAEGLRDTRLPPHFTESDAVDVARAIRKTIKELK